MRWSRVGAVLVVAAVWAAPIQAVGAEESYQLPGDPDPVADSECIPFGSDHALHADISSYAETDQASVDDWSDELDGLGSLNPSGWTVQSDNNAANYHNVYAMPVTITDSTTPRRLFRLGAPVVEEINPPNWWEGYMWRYLNGAGNLPDRAQIPVPNAAVGLPYTIPGVDFDLDDVYVEDDAPHNYGDRHYLTIETDECAAYDTFYAKRPDAFGNFSSLVNGGYNSFIADIGVKWDLSSTSAAYRDPAATFSAFGYGTATPFQATGNRNGTSHHESAAANRFFASDAAGLPLSAMVLRYDDVADDPLDHALHLALPNSMIRNSANGIEWPAIYSDGTSTDPDHPAMGTWFRLELTDTQMEARLGRSLTTIEENILAGLRTHGMILGDSTGGNWNFAVDADSRWTATERGMVTSLELADFTALVDPDTEMRPTTGTIASTYNTWFEIN